MRVVFFCLCEQEQQLSMELNECKVKYEKLAVNSKAEKVCFPHHFCWPILRPTITGCKARCIKI
jgi:hypothetical protein